MLKAVLFDLDGTIIDSNNAIFETYTQVAKRLGVEPPDIEVLRGLLGQPSNLNLPILFGDNKDARPIYNEVVIKTCLLYTSPSQRDVEDSPMTWYG